jgi:hypothetical protein
MAALGPGAAAEDAAEAERRTFDRPMNNNSFTHIVRAGRLEAAAATEMRTEHGIVGIDQPE